MGSLVPPGSGHGTGREWLGMWRWSRQAAGPATAMHPLTRLPAPSAGPSKSLVPCPFVSLSLPNFQLPGSTLVNRDPPHPVPVSKRSLAATTTVCSINLDPGERVSPGKRLSSRQLFVVHFYLTAAHFVLFSRPRVHSNFIICARLFAVYR